jgi:rfaE bifunctional protein nucleotidyltransferase chain/domain
MSSRKKTRASNKRSLARKQKTIGELARLSARLARQGKRIVTANGSFDLLHAGHVQFLEEAKAQGDVLIVGLNSDASIRRYKSVHRPIIPQRDRLRMVAALEAVDYVSVFAATTPLRFLTAVRPHVHCNGAEYGRDCVEAPLLRRIGARLHLVPKTRGLSTTQIIERIRRLAEE